MTVNNVKLVRSRRVDDALALEDQLSDAITISLWNAPPDVRVALARVQEYRSVNRAIKEVSGPPFELERPTLGRPHHSATSGTDIAPISSALWVHRRHPKFHH